MLARKVVNAEMQRDGWLVRFQVFAVAQPFTLKSYVMGRDCLADTRAPGPEESSRANLFHLCFGCNVQIERV
jgi:hypothetical protein